MTVPACYLPRFQEPEPLPADADSDEEEDEGAFVADVYCVLPQMSPPEEVVADLRQGKQVNIELYIQMALSGDAFIPGRRVPGFGKKGRVCEVTQWAIQGLPLTKLP